MGLLLSLIFSVTLASERVFVLDGKAVKFVDYTSLHLTVSDDCQLNRENKKRLQDFSCEAVKKISVLKKIKLSFKDFVNFGAEACLRVKGQVILGTEGIHKVSVCKFKDNSMISTGSLEYYLKP